MIKGKDYCVTDFNYLEEVKKMINPPPEVSFYDVTLREGNQTPGCVMRKEEMIAIAHCLDDLGVDIIEFFPAVSKDDEEVVYELSTTQALKHAKISALVRPKTKDIDMAIKTHAQHIFLEGPSNMLMGKLLGYSTIREVVQSFLDVVKIAKDNGMTITSCPWDAGKADLQTLEMWVTELAAAGVEDIAYGDSFGYSMPWTTIYLVRKYQEWAGKDTIISCHFHNDFGMATAGSLAAVAGGARRVQVSMNNLGERAGNAALDEIAVNLSLNMGVKTNIDLKNLYPISKKIEAITKKPIGLKKPVTGDETLLMGSGIPIDMMKKLAEDDLLNAGLPFNPALVGQPPIKVAYGKGVGSNMIEQLLRDMGIDATRDQVNQIVNAIKEESLLIKGVLTDFRVEQIVKETLKID